VRALCSIELMIAALLSALLLARRWFLLASARFSTPKGTFVEALPQEREQILGRSEPPLRAGINFFHPALKGVFRRARVGSKSNYKCEFHTSDFEITFQMDLCGSDTFPVETGEAEQASPLQLRPLPSLLVSEPPRSGCDPPPCSSGRSDDTDQKDGVTARCRQV
jgi:hypothetical protein